MWGRWGVQTLQSDPRAQHENSASCPPSSQTPVISFRVGLELGWGEGGGEIKGEGEG